MRIRALISDDEPLARDVVRLLLEERNDIEIIEQCSTGIETVTAIRGKNPDLVFLDVQMPDLDGFGVVKEIGVENMPVVIFVTAYDKYALRAFEVHALDYLLKPFDKERFSHALERAISQLKEKHSTETKEHLRELLESYTDVIQSKIEAGPQSEQYLDRLVIKESGRLFFVNVDEIDWIEAAGDYVSLHVGRNSHLLHETMTGLENKLNPQKFLRIHRSTIVNSDCIKELHPHINGEYHVFLKNGIKLKLSRRYRKNLQALFGDSL